VTDLLITGAYGQLGRAVIRAASDQGLTAAGRDLDTLDITDGKAVGRWIAHEHPHAVINCAAYTAVDDCEQHETEATRVNGTAVGLLAASCAEIGATLVHISTDYVFAGTGQRPYREGDSPAPVSAYGRSKLVGERAAATTPRHLIVRTAWLYGHGGHNFVEAIRAQVNAGASRLRVVADQRGTPTLSDDLADAIIDLVRLNTTGIIHATASGSTTWHGFAVEIVRLLGVDVEVVAVSSEDYPRPATRPSYSVLDTSRLAELRGPLPPWEDGLKRYLGAQ
jgi:dTDP-4-dehydrorhamnose reductase